MLNGTITKVMIGKICGMRHVCGSQWRSWKCFHKTYKADGIILKRGKIFWMRLLRTYAHFNLILKLVSDQSQAKLSIFLVDLPLWYFLTYWQDQVWTDDKMFWARYIFFDIYCIAYLTTTKLLFIYL